MKKLVAFIAIQVMSLGLSSVELQAMMSPEADNLTADQRKSSHEKQIKIDIMSVIQSTFEHINNHVLEAAIIATLHEIKDLPLQEFINRLKSEADIFISVNALELPHDYNDDTMIKMSPTVGREVLRVEA